MGYLQDLWQGLLAQSNYHSPEPGDRGCSQLCLAPGHRPAGCAFASLSTTVVLPGSQASGAKSRCGCR